MSGRASTSQTRRAAPASVVTPSARTARVGRAGASSPWDTRDPSGLYDFDLYAGLDRGAVDERRPVGDDVLDTRPAAGEAGHAGRAGQNEGRDLAREALHRRLLAALDGHAKLDLGQILGRRA